uniref:Uncharacterized protein n=1 Tax=Arundo donax TaxID=35708 RepID=A0A0A8Y7G7_ARUDO
MLHLQVQKKKIQCAEQRKHSNKE